MIARNLQKDVKYVNIIGNSYGYHPSLCTLPLIHGQSHLEIHMFKPFDKATVWEYKYILVAIDYFSKWVEEIAVKDFTRLQLLLVRSHIIYWFGVPETIMIDNGQPFMSTTLYKRYAKCQIKGNHSP